MKVLVCGGRNYFNRKRIAEVLSLIGPTFIVHGAARGADTLAGEWAYATGLPQLRLPVDWCRHGLKAGVLRNIWMLAEAKPELVVAFPGGRGTAHMVHIAGEAGVPVLEVTDR